MTTDTTATKRGFHFKDITKMFGGGQSTLRQLSRHHLISESTRRNTQPNYLPKMHQQHL